MNFSGIPKQTYIGWTLRKLLTVIPDDSVLPILQGSLRGKRWIVGSTVRGCWLGSYEHEKQRLFARTITEGAVVYDIGANVGFYCLLSSSLVGPSGKVIAFEPSPRNVAYLAEHVQLNGAGNVTIVQAAVGDATGTVLFDDGANPSMGRVSPDGSRQVEMVSLDDELAEGRLLPPDFVKIDVEGAELKVLHGAKALLAEHRPILFLATHSPDMHKACCGFLAEAGYDVSPIGADSIDSTDELVAIPCQSSR